MKVAVSSNDKSKTVEKLGIAIVASINKLKKIKTEMISTNDIVELSRQFPEFKKENANFS